MGPVLLHGLIPSHCMWLTWNYSAGNRALQELWSEPARTCCWMLTSSWVQHGGCWVFSVKASWNVRLWTVSHSFLVLMMSTCLLQGPKTEQLCTEYVGFCDVGRNIGVICSKRKLCGQYFSGSMVPSWTLAPKQPWLNRCCTGCLQLDEAGLSLCCDGAGRVLSSCRVQFWWLLIRINFLYGDCRSKVPAVTTAASNC